MTDIQDIPTSVKAVAFLAALFASSLLGFAARLAPAMIFCFIAEVSFRWAVAYAAFHVVKELLNVLFHFAND